MSQRLDAGLERLDFFKTLDQLELQFRRPALPSSVIERGKRLLLSWRRRKRPLPVMARRDMTKQPSPSWLASDRRAASQ